jgi:RNA polymerase sigma-70 factor (ECF subfamily)
MMGKRDAPAEGLSDEALLAGLGAGDESACLAFVRRYERRVYGLAVGMVGDPRLAEDISQETFLRVWRHATMFDARRGSVATWVLTIARNLAIDALRLHRATPTDPDELIGLGMLSGEPAPEASAEVSSEIDGLRAAFADLPHEQRRALVLAAIYGRTAAEISVIESIPLGTAKTRIRAGLGKVRAAVAVGGS